jgi:hypothetical protein
MELGIFTFEWWVIMSALAIVVAYKLLKGVIKWLKGRQQ